uniref:Transcription factor MYC/MYB N-terminal domain-containing protein n=2 Tax=Kalanchoe fedtschenkoi TaxID=63787 RepID=A0A7N0TRD5_KALFE
MAPDGDPQHELTSEFAVRQWIGSAVKSIQWSYGIFWSLSPSQPGVLKWGNGFYNGEMKSRSRSKSEAQQQRDDDEDTCSQRSEQLRELFKSLAASESNNTPPPAPAKKPPPAPAVISLEDLTQSEWFYLLCMSFIFNPGQELPGKAFAKGQPLWLCNAHLADNKVFGRSLLAKVRRYY